VDTLSLLRYLLPWLNPTRAWKEDGRLALVVDLDHNCLSGIRAGDSVEKLSLLGPATVMASGLAWPHKGIDVTVSDGRIQELSFCFGHAAEPGKGAFPGSFRYGGVPVRLSNASSESDIRVVFGPPYWRDQDEDEIILFYEFPGVEWQLELDLVGTLKHLRVGLPLLADAEQRAAYGVTKRWPPDYGLPPGPAESSVEPDSARDIGSGSS
jgi:hypothetical protein